MEVKNESTHKIGLFWKLFNEILSVIKGRDYIFNPKAIMVNENGANYCMIKQVFGNLVGYQEVSYVSCF